MSQPSTDVLRQASDYVRRGQLQLAQPLLVEYLKKNSQSAEAWYLLSSCVIEQRQQIDCLQRALRINPAFKEAQARLIEVMTAQPETPKPASSRPAWVEYQPPPPVEEQLAVPSPEVEPVEPTPPLAAIQVAEPPSDHVEAETLSGLRTEFERGEARPRRRRRLRGFLVIVLLMAAAAGGTALLIQRERNRPPVDQAATARAIAALPTVTPTFTPTPTFTSTPTDTPTPLPATWTSTPAPTQAPTRTPSPYPTPNDTVDASMRAIQRQVSAVRGLAIDASSGHYLIQPEDVAGVLRSVAKAQGMLDNLSDHARPLSALGLIKPTYDLVQYTLNGLVDNIGGFYVPATKDAFVAGDKYGPLERYVIAHEFAHVLIDQWYPLENTGAYPCTLDAQRCQAIRALVEGDANLAANQWLKSAPAQDKQVVDDFRPPALMLPDEFAPPFILRDLSFTRDLGASFAQVLYQRGGWSSLNKAYKNLPLSTEQILHPEKYLAGEKPIEVSLPPLTSTLGEGWRLIEDDVLGEWTTYLMLSSGVDEKTRLKDDIALNATRGWGGDRYHVYYKDATGETALAALWMWDTPLDALEFKQAMIAYLDQRFDQAKIDQSEGDCWAVTGQTTCLIPADRSALWLIAPDQSTIDAMRTALH